MKIILASASPRRAQLLEQVGISFEVKPSTVEEIVTKSEPSEVVEELSLQKAMDVAEKEMDNPAEEVLVIGADTIVTIDGKIMGKPKDEQDAKDMLGCLQGREHQVFTGVTFVHCRSGQKEVVSFSEETKVFLHAMSEAEIDAYVASKEPMDKAGAYGIQGKSAIYIERIDGDYNNVVGLPLARVYQEAKKLGYNLTK